MLGLLIFTLPLAEIFVIYKVGERFGFMNTAFSLLASFVLGLGIAKGQGRYILSRLQTSLNQSTLPASDVLHGLVVFVGGLLIAIPGFISDLAGVLLLLPGTRHWVVRFLRRRFEGQIARGHFKIFSFGGPSSDPWQRDVSPKVIDVAPISSHTTESPKK